MSVLREFRPYPSVAPHIYHAGRGLPRRNLDTLPEFPFGNDTVNGSPPEGQQTADFTEDVRISFRDGVAERKTTEDTRSVI